MKFAKPNAMVYIITFTSCIFARQLEEVAVIRLAPVRGLFASLKCSAGNQYSEQSPLVFNVSQQFSYVHLSIYFRECFGLKYGRLMIWLSL